MTTSVDFVMPSLGADMDSGTVTEWMIKAGDTVERGDVVAIVETDKADIDIEVWTSGVVSEILVQSGALVAVGTALAKLEVAGDAKRSASPSTEPAPVSAPPSGSAPIELPLSDPLHERGPAPALVGSGASPLARRLALERNIDLATLIGSGPGGAIVAADLAPAAAQQKYGGSEKEESGSKATRMRRAIADILARSKREIPHYYIATDIDLEAMLTWLGEANSERTVQDRILPAAVLMKAIATATADHREFNGYWIDDRFAPADCVHLGVAVSLRGGGLIAPAIHNADQLSIEELMVSLRDLVGRARAGRLKGSEMTDSTITVSNLGDRGVEVVHGVIYPPQVALVGLGRIDRRAAVNGEVVEPRHQVTATLAADHRATDGQVGARFLNAMNRLLQNPQDL